MNKKEIKSTAVRRRGTTIAAAALSVALVAPFVHPVVSPQSAAEAQAQTSGTVAATPVTDPTKIIEADGIANGYIGSRFDMTNALATLSGVVGLKETSASSSLKGTMGINDATVYMQFKDRDGTISPIFSTKSHQLGSSSGNYVFDLRAKGEDGNLLSHPDSEVPGGEYSFVDANGKPHLFRALRGQEYRIWVDSPLKNEETGNDLTYVRQAGGGVPGAWAPVTQGTANGAFYFENYNMQRTGVFLEERAPSVDEKSYMVSPDFSMDEEGWAQPSGTKAPRFSYFGRVWSDAEGGPDRNETGPLYWWKGDQPIEGAKVYASVLSDEGVAEFERLAIADKPYREQAAATKSMIENMRANGKEPILKTVGAETNADGRYTIRMGDDIGRRMKDYTYIWAEKDGKVLNSFSGFPTPVFQSVNANSGENPNSDGAVGIASFTNHRWYNINFAEVQADIVNLDIVNYDSFLNPADLPEGINNLEPANIKLTGALPFSGNNKIRWIGPDGKQIGEDCAVDTLADAANCSLAPEDFNNPGTYVAQLVNAYDVVVGQDSFIAVDKVRQNGEFEPQYEDATVPAGKKTTVDAPKDKDGQEIPEGTTFEPGGQVTDPEGNKVDKPEWITVNPDGSIEVEPPKDAKPGDYTIPVVVTYPDGSRETIEAKVTVEKPDAPESKKTTVDGDVKPVDPSNDPQDTGVKVTNPDDDTKISAKDEDGKDVPVEIDEDGKVIVTPGTDVDGPITVTITDPDLPDGKVDVEVPVNGHEKGKDDNGSEETPAPDASVVTDKVTVVEGQEADPFDTAKDV
ncbi:Rib/alpha-like domain-containing protein, partial [Corynebacterium sp. UMB6689]|uniref:Rib/alpha-like domain-containing protein n=2 Tax=Corynebacterium TaxID=1716 RepID=UPI00254DE4D6